jgi:catechol 2,3-dioxygenase-like lactoylglutathione lyase family enzyme
MTKLAELRRGVSDPAGVAAFFSRLLDVEPRQDGDTFRLDCANGILVIHGDVAVPVSVSFSGTEAAYRGTDPDGVPVTAHVEPRRYASGGSVSLDHLRLNCADLEATADFYRRLGCEYTWSGRDEEERDGPQETPLEGATWLHLSGGDGYLSLSQADWKEYGRHTSASGPPRFIHIGLGVRNLPEVVGRLDDNGVPYLRGRPAVGANVYLNDPDGDPRVGSNIELIEYRPGVQRSGLRHAVASSARSGSTGS